jgi:hypothetical protein
MQMLEFVLAQWFLVNQSDGWFLVSSCLRAFLSVRRYKHGTVLFGNVEQGLYLTFGLTFF